MGKNKTSEAVAALHPYSLKDQCLVIANDYNRVCFDMKGEEGEGGMRTGGGGPALPLVLVYHILVY